MKGVGKMGSLIQLDQVCLELKDKIILQDISFAISQGDFVTLYGPSGSGKSSLLKLVASLIQPTSGTIYFKGQDVFAQDILDYRKKVSYFFQNPVLFGQTVRDNLRFPYQIRHLNFDQDRALDLLGRVKLDQSILDKSIQDISGGEKQRVALVRNLLFPPLVLLLDEITSSLDRETSQIIQDLLEDLLTQGATILSVSHKEEDINRSSRKIQIVDGRMVD